MEADLRRNAILLQSYKYRNTVYCHRWANFPVSGKRLQNQVWFQNEESFLHGSGQLVRKYGMCKTLSKCHILKKQNQLYKLLNVYCNHCHWEIYRPLKSTSKKKKNHALSTKRGTKISCLEGIQTNLGPVWYEFWKAKSGLRDWISFWICLNNFLKVPSLIIRTFRGS